MDGSDQIFAPDVHPLWWWPAVPSSIQDSEGWDEIPGFTSPDEFRRFRLLIEEALAEGVLVETPVLSRYGLSEMLDERWYRAPSGQCWRLVAPDPPFTGVFLMVGG